MCQTLQFLCKIEWGFLAITASLLCWNSVLLIVCTGTFVSSQKFGHQIKSKWWKKKKRPSMN